MSNILDNLPHFISFDKLQSTQSIRKHIKRRSNTEKSTLNYCKYVRQSGIMDKHNQDINSDPNMNYEIIKGILTQLYIRYFSAKTAIISINIQSSAG